MRIFMKSLFEFLLHGFRGLSEIKIKEFINKGLPHLKLCPSLMDSLSMSNTTAETVLKIIPDYQLYYLVWNVKI